MCFSAGASFGASAVLSIIGTTAIMKARTVPQGLFAGIPMIFSLQQLMEGMLWLSLNDTQPATGQSFFTYTFLVFALAVWPVWIPLTILNLEKNLKRKKLLKLLLVTGIIASVIAGCAMIIYPVEVIRVGHHLNYKINIPPATKELTKFFSLFYFAAAIIPAFVSSVKRMYWLGIGFLFSYAASAIIYKGSVVSVWCYLAAILSIVVLWIIAGLQKSDSQQKTN